MKSPAPRQGVFSRQIPLDNQARFTMVNVFHEVADYTRDYTLPFDMIGVCLRAEGPDASVATNLLSGEECRARENNIKMVPHNLPQRYRHTPRYEHYGIHFKLELFPGVDVFAGQRRVIVENSPALRRVADSIFAEKDPVLLLSRAQAFALEFCHRHWPKEYPFDADRVRVFEPALRRIREAVDARVTVASLAALMKRSPDAFSREFREVFGKSPKDFLQRELFDRAARTLLAPQATVKSTADALGFSSEFYFSKFFKRLSGLSPREYRNRSFLPAIGREA